MEKLVFKMTNGEKVATVTKRVLKNELVLFSFNNDSVGLSFHSLSDLIDYVSPFGYKVLEV